MQQRRLSIIQIVTLTVILLFSLCDIKAQNSGSVKIVGDMRVTLLVEQHKEYNQRHHTTAGYRVQVASLSGTDSKRRAFELRDNIRNAFPEHEVYVSFDEPGFKVKVGDFLTRLEAHAFLSKIRGAYSGTIIRDNINTMPETRYTFDFDPNEE